MAPGMVTVGALSGSGCLTGGLVGLAAFGASCGAGAACGLFRSEVRVGRVPIAGGLGVGTDGAGRATSGFSSAIDLGCLNWCAIIFSAALPSGNGYCPVSRK